MTPADDIEDADPGLARERTQLAWTRTAISFAALGGAILKSHPIEGVPVLALSVLIWELGRLPGPRALGSGRSQARRLLLITVTVTGISIAALIMSFLGHGPGGFLINHR